MVHSAVGKFSDFSTVHRACPGQELSDTVLFISITTSAVVFKTLKAKDEHGNRIAPVNKLSLATVRFLVPLPISFRHNDNSNALSSHPNPFKCSVTI